MTESDWLTGGDPQAMLDHLRRDRRVHRSLTGQRKLRLFICACFRRLWHLIPDRHSRATVAMGEWLADGSAAPDEVWALDRDRRQQSSPSPLAGLVVHCLDPWPWESAQELSRELAKLRLVSEEIGAHAGAEVRADLLRELFGNPFNEVVPETEWLAWHDGCVWKMARSIHDNYRFEDLPVVADALEDAGCTDPIVLGHCRNGGPHARGCWVVDLLLGHR